MSDLSQLDAAVRANQNDIIDTLLTPQVRLPERGGAIHKIVASYPVMQETQPVQARGGIVWNTAYDFQPKGPSYLDPTEI
jgi:hypothetical protein